MLTVEKIKKIVAKVSKEYGVKNAYLFGSYARGEAHKGSDIDIIIDKGELQTYNLYCDMKFALEDKLGTKVDLLTMEGIKPRFFELIKGDRILLYGA